MINPLDELSDIYLGQISEADNSPEAIKARVMQHVRAIRYRARKEGDQLNKAYNDYMAGQAGISATEKSMVKERLGLTGGAQHQEGMAYGLSRGTGKPSGPMAAFGKKKTKKTKPTVTIDKPDKLVSLRVSKEGYYSWRHELSEYSGSMPTKESDAEKRITEKKIKNKVTVNPAQGQAESFAKELGGQLLEACEVFQIFEVDDDQIQLLEVKDRKGKGSGTKDACYHKVKSRYSVWPSAYASGALVKCRRVGAANWGNSTKKEDVQWKDIKYKAKSGESTFLSDSDGNIAFEIVDVIAPAVQEAKVDTGRSTYGKASIRNYRRMGPGYDTPAMFDPENKRGKTIDKRREEHKARRGVKGAKVPAYKVEEVEVVNEVSKKTLGSYVKKASTDLATRSIKHGMSGGTETGGDPDSPKNVEKINKRHSGIMKATDKLTKEDYETKKKEEIMGALKKRDLKQKVKEKIAADIIKRKGDVSKSDDRYAYESVEVVDEGKEEGGYISNAAKVEVRNQRRFGKKGSAEPQGYFGQKPSEKAELAVKRGEEHRARRGVKTKGMKEGHSNWRDTLDEKCWAGYEKKGMKTMFGKRYPNCVKKKTKSEEVEFQEKLDLKKADMGDVVKDFYKSDAPQFKGRSKEKRREMAIAAKLTAERGKLPEEVETVDELFGMGSSSSGRADRGDEVGRRERVKKAQEAKAKRAAVKDTPISQYKGSPAYQRMMAKMKKEGYSANPAQQAAIAIAKKERKQDLKVSQKKKMKEEIVTELSKNTLLNYSQKAQDGMRSLRAYANLHGREKAKKKIVNREKGMDRAHEKIVKDMPKPWLKKEEVVTELNRFEKEKGMDTKTGKPVTKGGTAKNDRAFQSVMKKFGKQRMGANQPKKVRGAKNPNETSPTKQKMTRMKAAKASSRAFETRAKKAGYKTAQDYANVVARYGGEDNMKKGRGLGT